MPIVLAMPSVACRLATRGDPCVCSMQLWLALCRNSAAAFAEMPASRSVLVCVLMPTGSGVHPFGPACVCWEALACPTHTCRHAGILCCMCVPLAAVAGKS